MTDPTLTLLDRLRVAASTYEAGSPTRKLMHEAMDALRAPSFDAGREAGIEAGPWRCFHCDEVFESRTCAIHHFGHNEGETPACKIKGAGEYALLDALRKAQLARDEAWQALSAEDTDSARVFHAMQADHQVALRQAEQAGYDKGLADGAALRTSPTPQAQAPGAVAEVQAAWREFYASYDGEAEDIARLKAAIAAIQGGEG
jgi:predicted transcriptional regulator